MGFFQVKPVVSSLPLVPFVTGGMLETPSVSGIKRKSGSPLREQEVLADDNLGLVTVEIVAGDESSKVRVKVSIHFEQVNHFNSEFTFMWSQEIS